MADWMRLGFVHGVMNTDNLSILGLTIDYGPYGWLEGYDPEWTPNTTDAQGRRYAYGNQPDIALWNLARLAEALLPLIAREELEKGLELYAETFQGSRQRALTRKLGLVSLDETLATELFAALAEAETDFTLFFRNLARVPLDEPAPDEALLAPLGRAFYGAPGRSLAGKRRPGRAPAGVGTPQAWLLGAFLQLLRLRSPARRAPRPPPRARLRRPRRRRASACRSPKAARAAADRRASAR